MVLSKLKEKFGNHDNKGDKKMKVAILGAGCYRTHAASGITNFSRACEVAEATGKENISMTDSLNNRNGCRIIRISWRR